MTTINTNQAGKFKVRAGCSTGDRFIRSYRCDQFIALGKVSPQIMTGNIAFLGLRIAGNNAPENRSILTSMLAFILGVFISTRIGQVC